MRRQPGTAELSTTSLMKYHEELISRLPMQEAEAAKAAADAADAEAAEREVDQEVTTATMAAADAETTGDATAAERARHAAGRAKAGQLIATVKAEHGAEDARKWMMAVAEWREFIREPLRRTREETLSRGMLPPALMAGRPRDVLVFTAPEGGPVDDGNFRDRIWYPAVEAAGIRRLTLRTMRHTAASWLVIDGVPLYDVQALRLHESYRTTERCAHLGPDAHDKVVQSWARHLDASVTHERKQGRPS